MNNFKMFSVNGFFNEYVQFFKRFKQCFSIKTIFFIICIALKSIDYVIFHSFIKSNLIKLELLYSFYLNIFIVFDFYIC